MIFKIGFKYKKFRYGWHLNVLYRLPAKVDNRNYSLKELNPIDITDNIQGYRIEGEKLSLARISELNKKVNWKINLVTGKDFNIKVK